MESETYEIKVLEKDIRYDRRTCTLYCRKWFSPALYLYRFSTYFIWSRLVFSFRSIDRILLSPILQTSTNYQNITYALQIYVSAGAIDLYYLNLLLFLLCFLNKWFFWDVTYRYLSQFFISYFNNFSYLSFFKIIIINCLRLLVNFYLANLVYWWKYKAII